MPRPVLLLILAMPRPVFLLILALALPASAHGQQFGGSLAVADGAVFVSETRNQVTPGVIYVYHDDGEWREAARLSASDHTGAPDRFGRALSVSGATLLVGASSRDASTGAAYIFDRNAAGAWQETARLHVEGLTEGDEFGTATVLRGSLALVAAPGQNDNTGCVYVFERAADGNWSEVTRITGAGTAGGDRFGTALAFEGSLALVSAPSQEDGAGAAYVFRRDEVTGAWREEARLTAAEASPRGRLGTALAIHDGRAYAGAPGVAGQQGAVIAFAPDSETGTWQKVALLRPFETVRFSRFGTSIAPAGDNLWIGAPGANGGQGAIYRYVADDQSWAGVQILSMTELQNRASFGSAVAIRGDAAVVGAIGVDFREGAAVIYSRAAQNAAWEERRVVINDVKGFDSIVGGEVPCEDGEAAGWQCQDVDLAAFLPTSQLGGARGTSTNDIWGWTDPDTDREYALVGRSDGTAFVDVTNPYNPEYLGNLPMTEGSRANVWRDIKVYKDHAFIVADGAGEHGMQVFDLAQLRTVTKPPAMFEATAHYDQIHSAHNIVINEETGFAYSVGSSGGGETCGGGLHMIDIRQPTSPKFAGCFADPTTGRRKTGYSHDAQCVIYHGPDAAHQGKEICFGLNETALSIADVTNKEQPAPLSMATYPKVAYAHQGWLTEDHRYFYMNDEGDEPQGLVEGTRTLIWDLTDLDDPVLIKEYIAETTTTDHNLYIQGNLMYQSNYGSGLRILDISDPENPVEVGFFDTTPYEASGGSWSNYPYFKSGVIVVTSIGEGLFVLKKQQVDT